jgi:hypothetical protein
MEVMPRGVPRYPAPKRGFVLGAALPPNLSPVQIAQIGLNTGTLVLEGIDANPASVGPQSPAPTFQLMVSFDATDNPLYIIFSGQVSPTTGLYFPWRGELEIGENSTIHFWAQEESWHVVLWGYQTST